MRILDKAHIPYAEHTYDSKDGAIDGMSVASKLHQNVNQVFKTLVTQGHSKQYYVFVIPVAKELNLKAAAKSGRRKICGDDSCFRNTKSNRIHSRWLLSSLV